MMGRGATAFAVGGLFKRSEILAAFMLIGVLLVMVVPVPPMVMDMLLTFNITLSIIILLVSLFIAKPLDFSVFPSLLLMVTLFRLSLNIATTRLILLHGNRGPLAAGKVIKAFGHFVVGGNYVVGFIVFLILVVINFVVITKGAGRIAEVAARFTLDAMPGKQMSIDADLNAGLITEDEARRRRQAISMEADFYGAMDGASKFVRGDAIASVIITLINILGGLVIGVLQQGMPLGEAARTYTILTVGDGLVSQIPALIVSTAAGIIISRAASEEDFGQDIIVQLFSHHRVVMLASVVLVLLGLVPGLPHLPFLFLGSVAGVAAYKMQLSEKEVGLEEEAESEREAEEVLSVPPLDPITLEVGYRLISLVDVEQGGDLLERIRLLRKRFAEEMGFILPPVRIKDNLQLDPNTYVILIRGIEVASGSVYPKKLLAISNDPSRKLLDRIEAEETREPVFNLPAYWIAKENSSVAKEMGFTVVDAVTVLMTHFSEVVKQHAYELLDRQSVQELLEGLRSTHPRVVDEIVPNVVSLGTLEAVLQNLLKEQVSVRDLVLILETLANYSSVTKDPEVLTEFVREKLGKHIVRQILGKGKAMSALALSQGLEERILSSVQQTDTGTYISLDPAFVNSIVAQINAKMGAFMAGDHMPVVVCSPEVRRFFRRLIERINPGIIVLSFNEIPRGVKLKTVGVIEVSSED